MMGTCIYSHDDGAYCDKHDHGAVTVGCCGEDKCPDRKALTNADRIRSMTDEELAHLLHSAEEHLFTGNLWNYEKWTEWLKQEADNGEN